MHSFLDQFTNREIAIFIWFSAIFGYVMFGKEFRSDLVNLFKALFQKKLFAIILCGFFYSCLEIYILFELHFWNYLLLKDSALWFFGVGFAMIFHLEKIGFEFFEKTIKDAFKWTIIIEFISNLYVFTIPIELVVVFLLFAFGMGKPLTEKDPKYKDINSCITKLLSILGAIVFLFALYKTIVSYREVFAYKTLQELLLSPLLTLLYLPLAYVIALYLGYEELFVRIKFMTSDANLLRAFRHTTVKIVGLNLRKLNKVSLRITKIELHKIRNLEHYLKGISR